MNSPSRRESEKSQFNPLPQNAPGNCSVKTYSHLCTMKLNIRICSCCAGTSAAVGHHLENSIPLSIFPIATDKFCVCFCGMPGK